MFWNILSFLRFAQDIVCPLLVILSDSEESHPFFTQEVFQLESSFASPSHKLRASAPGQRFGALSPSE